MSEEDKKNSQQDPPKGGGPVREVVLPLAMVLALVGNAWWGGVGWGRVSSQLDQVLASMNDLRGRTSSVEQRLSEVESWRRMQEENLKQRDQEFRLFKMYTKGRIARLPYRSTDDGE